MSQVTVLYARQDSIYKKLPDCDVYDIGRNARTYRGKLPVVAHPPCRSWGRLRKFAKPRDGERRQAIFAVRRIQKNGGVLEHPAHSTLWKCMGLPRPGADRDRFGGFTLSIDQFWFGHRAKKGTWLYICGIEPSQVPALPIRLDRPQHVVRPAKNNKQKLGFITKTEREATPPSFAVFLCEIARRCAAANDNAATASPSGLAADQTDGCAAHEEQAR